MLNYVSNEQHGTKTDTKWHVSAVTVWHPTRYNGCYFDIHCIQRMSKWHPLYPPVTRKWHAITRTIYYVFLIFSPHCLSHKNGDFVVGNLISRYLPMFERKLDRHFRWSKGASATPLISLPLMEFKCIVAAWLSTWSEISKQPGSSKVCPKLWLYKLIDLKGVNLTPLLKSVN